MSISGNLTVHQAVEEYLLAREARYSQATVRNEGHVLRRFAETVTPRPVQLRNLTADHVERWFLALRREHRDRGNQVRPPIAPGTWNFYYARIKSFTEWASRKGHLRHDLLAHVLPLKDVKRVRQQPGVDLLLAMLDNAREPRNRALLAVAMNTGLRSSEIARLRVGDLDLKGLSLRVWIAKSQVEDDVPVTADLAGEMARWLAIYARALGRPLQVTDYLLPAVRGPRYVYRVQEDGQKIRGHEPGGYDPSRAVGKLERIVQEGLRSVGLSTKGEGVHTIRRAVARAFYDRLADEGTHETAVRVVSSLLHHTNVSTTERYLGLTREMRTRDQSLRGQNFLIPTLSPAQATEIHPA